ncbi:MAG: phosphohydrolase, partial [Oceanospirillaceae bacterium]
MLMVFVIITVLLYCSSATIQYLQLTNETSTSFNVHKNTSRILAIIAIIMHTFILQSSLHLEQGLNLSIFTSGSLVSWLVALVLLISSFRQKVDNLFIAVFPMAALLILLNMFF